MSKEANQLLDSLVAGVLPSPYAYAVYVAEADNEYIVYTLDDPQLVDDATNHDASTTALYTSAQVRQAIADALATERERCAVLCDGVAEAARRDYKAAFKHHDDGRSDGANECSDAIRSRQ